MLVYTLCVECAIPLNLVQKKKSHLHHTYMYISAFEIPVFSYNYLLNLKYPDPPTRDKRNNVPPPLQKKTPFATNLHIIL